jgi:hypothetical protein
LALQGERISGIIAARIGSEEVNAEFDAELRLRCMVVAPPSEMGAEPIEGSGATVTRTMANDSAFCAHWKGKLGVGS